VQIRSIRAIRVLFLHLIAQNLTQETYSMTETLIMNNLFHTLNSPATENDNPSRILDILLTGTMLASAAGTLASISIIAAMLSGSTFDKHDITALVACIVVLTVISTLSWLGIRIAIRDARLQAANLAAILSNISDGVLVLDQHGRFVSANPALLRMIPEDRLKEMNALPLEETVQWQRTVFSVAAAPVPGAGSVVIFHDETRRYETEQAKEALLATASHELRTPLGVVMNYLELLLMLTETGKVDSARFAEHLNRAIENSRRLLRLINDILDHAQLQAGTVPLKEKTFNLAALLEKTHGLMAGLLKEKQLFYELSIAPGTPAKIIGDPERLQKVLLNLIGNAVKFTNQGGIRVRVSVRKKNTLSIDVMDTGPGIPDEHLPDIFEAFRRASNYAQREHQGAGLGLSIAKQLTASMGGEISVSSALGVGSTFTISLPLDRTIQ
jgi:signal transduction histidine kinase